MEFFFFGSDGRRTAEKGFRKGLSLLRDRQKGRGFLEMVTGALHMI